MGRVIAVGNGRKIFVFLTKRTRKEDFMQRGEADTVTKRVLKPKPRLRCVDSH